MMTATETALTTVKVGDFFEESWGYDQTNADFYQVVKVSTSGKTVWMRHVRTEVVRANESAEYLTPVVDGFDEIGAGSKRDGLLRKAVRVFDLGNGPTVSVHMTSYSSAYLWDGKPAYQTDSRAGH
jgi:hypothetical protein